MRNFHGRIHLYEATAPAKDFFIGQALVFEEQEATEILHPDYTSGPSVAEIVALYYEKVKDLDEEVNKMQYLDVHQWMPKDILLKADKMSMAGSLELRVPLLDIEVMKVAQTIPTKYLINQYNTKRCLFVKQQIVTSQQNGPIREKLGFPVPIRSMAERRDWLQNRQKNYLQRIFAAEFFDQEKILQLLADHRAGKQGLQRKIWTIYTFLTWYKSILH